MSTNKPEEATVGAGVTIPTETVKEIAAGVILKTLDAEGQKRMVEALIEGILNADARRYSSDPEQTLLESVIKEEVVKVIRVLVGEWLEENRSFVNREVRKEMEHKFVSKIVAQSVDTWLSNFEKMLTRSY